MKHIIEYTGQKRIQNLSPEDVQSFADHLSSISLSGVYIHAAISLLKRFLQEYVDRGEIPYNPCLHVQMPTIDTPEASPFTKKDIQIILDNLSGTKYKNAIKLSLLTAMRIGEVLGLTWDKVDFANKTITIDQQIHHGSSEILPYVKNHNPKTVHYPQEVFDLLSEVKQQQDSLARFAGELWDNPSNLIFTTEFGKPIPHPSILEAFKKAAEPTGRKSRRIHDLRHTTLSYIWEDTHDIDKVMQVSRHKNRLSARVYIHPTEKTQEEAAALISSVAKKLNIV
jgi:integrase